MFFDTFVELCAKRGVSCKRAVTDMGLSNSLASKWKRTGATPSGETLNRISNYFSVPIDELFEKDPKEIPVGKKADGLSGEDEKLLKLFHLLSDEQQTLVLGMIVAASKSLES